MAEDITLIRSKAEHYRELAQWTSDERAHRTLLDMARELEAEGPDDMPPPGGIQPQSLPRSLS
jgi:hypothetical protein